MDFFGGRVNYNVGGILDYQGKIQEPITRTELAQSREQGANGDLGLRPRRKKAGFHRTFNLQLPTLNVQGKRRTRPKGLEWNKRTKMPQGGFVTQPRIDQSAIHFRTADWSILGNEIKND